MVTVRLIRHGNARGLSAGVTGNFTGAELVIGSPEVETAVAPGHPQALPPAAEPCRTRGTVLGMNRPLPSPLYFKFPTLAQNHWHDLRRLPLPGLDSDARGQPEAQAVARRDCWQPTNGHPSPPFVRAVWTEQHP